MPPITVPLLLMMSALLPYVSGNLRVDQVMIPLVAAPAFLMGRRHYFSTLTWTIPLIASLVMLAISSRLSWQTGLATNGLYSMIRIALPVLALIVLPTTLANVPDVLKSTMKAIVFCASATSLFALAALVSPRILDIMTYWVQIADDSVWSQSRDVGRFSGIFNQPLEAGVFYSVALLALVYCWKHSAIPKIALIAFLALIMSGGLLSLSKNFVVVGVVAVLALALWTRVLPPWLAVAIGVPVVAIVPPLFIQQNPAYIDSLLALYYAEGLMAALTAGRFGGGEGSQVELLFRSLFEVGDWPLGRGVGSHLPLDNGFLEFFYQGGIVALGGFMLALGALFVYGWRERRTDAGRLLVMLVIFTAGSSLGGPAFTANRADIPLLLAIAASIVEIRRAGERRGASAGALVVQSRSPKTWNLAT